jgi:hypothetical protein
LKEFISKIEIFVRGHEEDVERADEYISEVIPPAVAKGFRKFVSARSFQRTAGAFVFTSRRDRPCWRK